MCSTPFIKGSWRHRLNGSRSLGFRLCTIWDHSTYAGTFVFLGPNYILHRYWDLSRICGSRLLAVQVGGPFPLRGSLLTLVCVRRTPTLRNSNMALSKINRRLYRDETDLSKNQGFVVHCTCSHRVLARPFVSR